jgi:hypothetical protein
LALSADGALVCNEGETLHSPLPPGIPVEGASFDGEPVDLIHVVMDLEGGRFEMRAFHGKSVTIFSGTGDYTLVNTEPPTGTFEATAETGAGGQEIQASGTFDC